MTIMRIVAVVLALTAVPFTASAQAQTPTAALPGYLFVVGKTTDRAKIGAYAAALPPIYASHNAYYLAIGGAGRGVTWLEGPWQDRSIILGKFPSRDEVDTFWWGDAYREAIKKRANAGVFSVVALTGTTPNIVEGVGAGFLVVMTAPRDGSRAQTDLSRQAAETLTRGVMTSGGIVLTSPDAGHYTSLEGDTVFDRFIIAGWPSLAARDAYLASPQGRHAARIRARLGLSAVASANGVPRSQAPPASTPPNN